MNLFARIIMRGYRAWRMAEYSVPIWQRWETFSIPHRPTGEDIAAYREFIGRDLGEYSKLLILGATPELRRIALQIGLRPTLVDISHEMLTVMLRYVSSARLESEVWMEGNWLDMVFPRESFDVVAGDLFLRHVNPVSQEKLLERIACASAPDGKFVTRIHVINPVYQERSYKEIFDEIKNFPYEERKYDVMGILLSRLFDRSTKNGLVSHADIKAALKEYLREERMPFSYRLFLLEFIERRIHDAENIKCLASQTKEEIESRLKKYFAIKAVRIASDYPEAEFYPMYFLQPL